MQTSHKLTRILVALFALIVLAAAAMAQAPTTDINVNDQKAGAILVYPYYTSDAQTNADTRITLSNLGTATAAVHLFFLDRNCSQADTYVCLTPNASIVMKASEFDPDVKGGWLMAVNVDRNGVPVNNSWLIGNAFVNNGTEVGNYGAEAFDLIRSVLANDQVTATMFYRAPNQFAVEIQSPNDATGQKIVTVGLQGTIAGSTMTGAGQSGTGVVYNGNEKPFGSFTGFIKNGCRSEAIIDTKTPRVPLGLGVLLPSGQIGTMKWGTANGSVGLLITPTNNKWYGIRGLHKTSEIATETVIPVFNPMCN